MRCCSACGCAPAEDIPVKSAGQAQRFLSAHDQINNLFPLCREHVPATDYRAARTRAFELWAEITGVAAAA
jgi:putative transposase